MQIKRFLELSGEFVNTQIDNEDNNAENLLDVEEIEEDNDEIKIWKINQHNCRRSIQFKRKLIKIYLIT